MRYATAAGELIQIDEPGGVCIVLYLPTVVTRPGSSLSPTAETERHGGGVPLCTTHLSPFRGAVTFCTGERVAVSTTANKNRKDKINKNYAINFYLFLFKLASQGVIPLSHAMTHRSSLIAGCSLHDGG